MIRKIVTVKQMLMEEAGAAGAPARDRSPEYRAPGLWSPRRGQRERSTVLNAYYTQNFRPRQVAKVPNVAQVTEGRKRSKEGEAQGTRRGRERRQSNSLEHQEQGTPGDGGRRQSQEAIRECKVCQTMPGRTMREDPDPARTGRRRLTVLSMWTPEPKSRIASGSRPGARSPGPSRSGGRTRCGDEF